MALLGHLTGWMLSQQRVTQYLRDRRVPNKENWRKEETSSYVKAWYSASGKRIIRNSGKTVSKVDSWGESEKSKNVKVKLKRHYQSIFLSWDSQKIIYLLALRKITHSLVLWLRRLSLSYSSHSVRLSDLALKKKVSCITKLPARRNIHFSFKEKQKKNSTNSALCSWKEIYIKYVHKRGSYREKVFWTEK